MPTVTPNPPQPRSPWAWMWLAYTGFLFIQPVLEPSRILWLGTLAATLVFLGIFFTLFYAAFRKGPARFWLIGATFTLGAVVFPWNCGASTFFIYAAAFLPFLVESTRRVVFFLALECAAVLVEGAVFTWYAPSKAFYVGWPNTIIAIFLLIVIGGGNIYFAEQRRADCKLRAALEENVTLAAVAERERIARDLHDVLGHTLSLIVLKAELAQRLVARNPARASEEMADVEATARTALAEIREAIGGYRSRGLAAEIDSARRTLQAAGVTLLADSTPAPGSLAPQQETALALALREAVTNIVRHACATACNLRFLAQNGGLRLVVEDDGPQAVICEGNGLRGMRERVESIGGRFSLECPAAPDHGTRLTIDLPQREAAAS